MSCECSWGGNNDGVALDEFVPYVRARIRQVPADLAAFHIRLAAIDLARHTVKLVRSIVTDIQAGVSDYPIVAPDGYNIFLVEGVFVDGDEVCLRPERGGGDFQRGYADPGYRYDRDAGVVLDWCPARDIDQGLRVAVCVTPGQDTCFLPKEFYDFYAGVLSDYALSRLYLTQGAGWHSLEASQRHEVLYLRELAQIKGLALKGNSSGPLIARTPRFFI